MSKYEDLSSKYPLCFQNGTYRCFECGEGWYKLIDELCRDIESEIAKQKDPGFYVVQIKEKLGSLRFYMNRITDEMRERIAIAEKESRNTCEFCGSQSNVTETQSGWIRHLCDKCQ